MQTLYEHLVEEFAKEALKVGDIEVIIVYGSVARGEATEDSDLDLLIITSQIDKVREKLSEIRTDLDLKYHTLITLVYRSPEQLFRGLREGNPFLRNILNEGRAIYARGIFKEIFKTSF